MCAWNMKFSPSPSNFRFFFRCVSITKTELKIWQTCISKTLHKLVGQLQWIPRLQTHSIKFIYLHVHLLTYCWCHSRVKSIGFQCRQREKWRKTRCRREFSDVTAIWESGRMPTCWLECNQMLFEPALVKTWNQSLKQLCSQLFSIFHFPQQVILTILRLHGENVYLPSSQKLT